MIVDSKNPEFGYEMISTIPYAYYLHKQGKLKGTISAKGSEPFYYFSPKHKINQEFRSWYNVEKMNTPNRDIHKPELDTKMFEPPPYKEHYANDLFKWQKPTLCIFNRHNNEWPANPLLNRPINYFSVDFLDKFFSMFENKYQIVYFNIDRQIDLQDNAPAIELEGEFELLSLHQKVLNVYELMTAFDMSYNETQLKVMANCEMFVTMNGGTSILASYFGGKNIIYTNPKKVNGRIYPRENQTGDFNYYHLFGGSEIVNVHKYNDIIKHIR